MGWEISNMNLNCPMVEYLKIGLNHFIQILVRYELKTHLRYEQYTELSVIKNYSLESK